MRLLAEDGKVKPGKRTSKVSKEYLGQRSKVRVVK